MAVEVAPSRGRSGLVWGFAAVVGAAAFVGTSREARASTGIALDLNGLVSRADVVVRGTVGALRAEREGSRIVTRVELRVVEVLAGKVPQGERFVITAPGGVLGDLVERVDGAPEWRVGEEVVVFSRTVAGVCRVVGLSQGKLRVDRATGRAVPESSPELVLVDAATRRPVASPLVDLSLSELRRRVRLANEGRAR